MKNKSVHDNKKKKKKVFSYKCTLCIHAGHLHHFDQTFKFNHCKWCNHAVKSNLNFPYTQNKRNCTQSLLKNK